MSLPGAPGGGLAGWPGAADAGMGFDVSLTRLAR